MWNVWNIPINISLLLYNFQRAWKQHKIFTQLHNEWNLFYSLNLSFLGALLKQKLRYTEAYLLGYDYI